MPSFSYETEIEVPVKVRLRVVGEQEAPITGGPPDGWDPGWYWDERQVLGIEIGGQPVIHSFALDILECMLREAIEHAEVCDPGE